MAAKVWSGVNVNVQSVLATALVITAITKANPGVATYTGTDPANGDYLVFTNMVGMSQMVDRIARVAAVAVGPKTFQLEAIDTTLFDTFTSGNAAKITFGNSLSSATNVTASGGQFQFVDTTTINSLVQTRIPTVASPITYQFTAIWDPVDTALAALKAFSDAKAKAALHVAFADSTRFLFYGFVGFAFIPVGSALQLVTCQIDVDASGRPTAYAT